MKIHLLTLCLACLFLPLAGCSPTTFKNADLSLDSAEARTVAGQLVRLKDGGAAGLEPFLREYAVTDSAQTAMLRSMLESMATADTLELRSADQFGPEILRVVIRARRGADEGERAFLLVRKDNRLLWAAPN